MRKRAVSRRLLMQQTRPDDYWAFFFGLSVADFPRPGLRVVPHAGLHDYQGAWLFQHGSSSIISVPPEWVLKVEGDLSTTITDQDFVALFGERVTKVIGPAYHGALEKADFSPIDSAARLLSAADADSLDRLRAVCDEQEWDHSDIDVDPTSQPQFGLFVGSELVAVANYRMEAEDVAAPGLVTHPNYRGQGYSKAVLSAATQHGLSHGFLMLYQTLLLNLPAIRAAQSLGYKHYATHLAVRLR